MTSDLRKAARRRPVSRTELRWSNRMRRFYAAATPRDRAYVAFEVWRATVKQTDPAGRDAHFERIADLLVNDAMQIDAGQEAVA